MYQNAVGVGDVVRRLDVVARDEVGEDRSGDVVEEVAGLNGVDGDALGDAGAVGAGAGERDVDDLAFAHRGGARGRLREAVGAEDGPEVGYAKQGVDGGESGLVRGTVADYPPASGGGVAAEPQRRRRRGAKHQTPHPDKE